MKLKISTLFHWLYATLMFLPILMFIPSCLYYGFNEHATNETTTTINYKYQSNEVNTLDDLVEGNIYQFNCLNKGFDELSSTDNYLFFELLSPLKININGLTFSEGQTINEFGVNTYLQLYHNADDDCEIMTYYSNEQYIQYDYTDLYIYQGTFLDNCNIRLLDYNFTVDELYTDFSYTDYNVIESVETNVHDTISNKMYQAWEGVWNLPVFAWTKNSFVSAPFSYITGLFGLSSDNSINYVFTYFVSISICWLVFDLIMYVPNLAHRWLDRSAIE